MCFHDMVDGWMDITVKEKDTGDLYLTPLLQQTAFWSDVKSDLGYRLRAFDIRVRGKDIRKGERGSCFLVDDILVLEKRISDSDVIAYVPYGPLLTPDEDLMGSFIEELSEALRDKLDEDTILIRYDLPWFRDGDISPESMEIMLNWGTVSHNIRAASSVMLPVNTTFFSLREDKEEIFARMKRKTRYNTGLAARHGVKIRVGTSEDLGIFLSLYEETAKRNHIRNHGPENFAALFRGKSDAEVMLLIAEREGIPLSSMFLSLSDDMASYLYGASS
ncbi:MAG: lipid II:glycine glycyltransferase FemX [Bullifex sp.]